MQLDFPTILFLAALITGAIWAFDAVLLAPRRRQAAGTKQAKEPLLVEYARSFFPIIVVVLALRSFLVEPFRIPSGSMMPTLLSGDFILVNKFAYGLRLPVINQKIIGIGEPQRGDVIVFRYPRDPSTDYIKRVVGLPGDVIQYQNRRLTINNQPVSYKDAGIYKGTGADLASSGAEVMDEQLGKANHEVLWTGRPEPPEYPCLSGGRFTVPAGHYFVMGDNRDNSNDSRYWCTVPDANIVGKAFFIWMNWDPVEGGVDWKRIGTLIR